MQMNVKMQTIVGILTFMTMINFMRSWVEHEKKFYYFGFWVQTVCKGHQQMTKQVGSKKYITITINPCPAEL